MSANLKDIDIIIERTKVSYKVAKEMLEKTDGDVVEAIIAIEQLNQKDESKADFEFNKSKRGRELKFLSKQLLKLLKKSLVIKIVWKKEQKQLLELPLLVVVLIGIWTMPFSFIALVIPFFFGVKMILDRGNGSETDVNAWIKNKTE